MCIQCEKSHKNLTAMLKSWVNEGRWVREGKVWRSIMISEIKTQPKPDLRCRTEKCWDKIDEWVGEHFVTAMVLTILVALGPLFIISLF
jgi:hypothetical protein